MVRPKLYKLLYIYFEKSKAQVKCISYEQLIGHTISGIYIYLLN